VEARSGRVIEQRGDEVLAVFADEGQAVRAALELQATLAEEMAADSSLPLTVGVGIDAGDAVPVGEGYRGAALNMAARLCARAGPGQVLVSEGVRDAAGGFELGVFQPCGHGEMKGFDQPVALFEAVSSVGRLEIVPRSAAPFPLPGPLAGGAELIGRDHELAWLRGAWRAARRGAGRVLCISGPDGSGKTALAAALAEVVSAEGYDVVYAGAGGAAIANAGDIWRRACSADRPLLAVLDDLEVIGDDAQVGQPVLDGAPTLALLLLDDPDASPRLAELVAGADARGDSHRRLGALDAEAVLDLARLYAGDDVDEVPVESILRSSDGLPSRVHELLDGWARAEAARRLEAAAQWLAAGRERRTADLDFAQNAIERRLRHIYGDGIDAVSAAECPYMGLAAFGEGDADRFFGRERLVGDLAARTVATGLLALVGPSGGGKSSLLLAGLLPSLRAGILPGSARWTSYVFRPGAHPLEELDTAGIDAATAERRLVVAIDQFEEVFTLCDDEGERRRFIDLLVDAASQPERIAVVLAVRGDFLDRIASYPALAELVSANQVLVGPMTREEYRRAIEQPARRSGMRIESALVGALLDEAVDQAGALPLLSTAMVELWARQSDGWLRMESLEATGGLHGAVARLAESSYQQLSADEQRTARRLFLRLAGSGEGEAVTRARVPFADFDLEGDPGTGAVIDRFVGDRLLTRAEDTVEVAHEALLREWPRLREWLDEEGQGRVLRHHLTAAARNWEENGRRGGDLYRAERLSAALAWSADHGDQMNRLEHEFLRASQVASTRAIRRLRAGVAVLALLLLAAIIAGVVALSQRRSAQHAADVARTQARVAIAQRVGLQAGKSTDLATSLLLAVAGDRLAPSAVTDGNLLQALQRAGSVMTIYHSPTRLLGDAVTPDGRILEANTNDGRVILFDTATAQEIAMLPAVQHIDPVGAAFSPDGSLLAAFAGNGRGLLALYDTQTHRVVATVSDPVSNTSVDGAAFSPDGRSIAALSFRQAKKTGLNTGAALYVWSVPGLHRIAGPVTVPWNGASVSVMPDGRIVTTSQSGITVWQAHPLRPLHRYAAPNSGTYLTPDGTQMALVQRRTLAFVDLRTGHVDRRVTLPARFHPATFAADGESLFGTSKGGRVAELDLSTGALSVVTSQGGFSGFTLAPDGRSIYTVSLDKTAERWGLNGGSLFSPAFRVAPPGRGSIVVSPGGNLVATLAGPPQGYGATVKVWDMRTGRMVAGPFNPGEGGAGWAALSPDGRLVAAPAFANGHVVIWDARTGAVVRRLAPPVDRETLWIVFSPNGRLVATATERQVRESPPVYGDGWTYVWNVRTGRLVDSFRQPGQFNGVSTAVFNADSSRIVSVGEGGLVADRDLAHHRLVGRPWPTNDAVTIQGVFSPNGRMIATGGAGGGLVSLWTPSGGKILPPITSANTVYAAGFYDSGRRLAVGRAQDVQLWDVASRRLIGALPVGGKPNGIVGATVTPDGRTLVTTSSVGILRMWPLARAQWVRDACLMANRELTLHEWRAYLAGLPYESVCR
jgi:WD40 repeat protein